MTPYLERVRARAEAAYEGPWTTDYDKDGCLADHKGFEIALTNDRDYASFPHRLEQCQANAAFIAHAREDVPELLRRVECAARALEAILAPYTEVVTDEQLGCKLGDRCRCDRHLARNALQALRADKEGG